jgi:hypothetical protein
VTFNETETLRLLVTETGIRVAIAALVVWVPWCLWALRLRVWRVGR